MNILGISAFYHDSAACLVRDGGIIAAAQEERFTRIRHDESFPERAIEYCLQVGGISAQDLDLVAFYDKPWIKFERILETSLAFAPRGFSQFIRAVPLWLKQKLWMGEEIARRLDYEGEIIYPEHHQSHAASAFYPSPFGTAAILTLDGVGEWATSCLGQGTGARIELLSELRFPHSLGLLYSAFTYYTGFKVNSGEYKLMGLAPYGEPIYVDKILEHLIDLKADGSFRLNLKYFNYCTGLTMTSNAFHELFGGEPRDRESLLTQREMDLARSIQVVTEEVVLRMARHLKQSTNERNLVLAGGVALNCVANGRIHKERIFDNIWVQPAAGDAGGALGAALFAWHQVLNKPRELTDASSDSMQGALLGPEYSGDSIEAWLKAEGIPHHRLSQPELLEQVARLLTQGKVVGWFSGRMEFGPRALGARSILGDARSSEMQSKMNLLIKFRESFRPFAPAVLRESVADYFEYDADSPYMLMVAPILESRRLPMNSSEMELFGIDKLNLIRSDIPAVTHVDYSARLQTVAAETHPRFYLLLKEFERQSGVPILINTSFNVRGEPIVCAPEDAYRCFMRTGIECLVLEDCILYKGEQAATAPNSEWQKEFELD